MAMVVACPACRAQYRLDPSRLREGRGRLRCARCGTVFPVASESEPAAKKEPTAPGGAQARKPPARGRTSEQPAQPRGRDAGRDVAAALNSARSARLDVALVAGDPGELRRRIVSVLAHCKIRTVTVDDGPACLEAALRSRPRLLVLQAWLHGLLGTEVAALVRAEPTLARADIVLVGGPPLGSRHGISPATVHGVDHRVPDDVSDPELERVVRTLLGLPGAALPPPDETEVQRYARNVVADLLLHHADAIDAGLRLRTPLAGIQRQVEDARIACIERFPAPVRAQAGVLAHLDHAMEEAFRQRRQEMGIAAKAPPAAR